MKKRSASNMVILSTQRSGTIMLMSTLDRLRGFNSIGEIFKHNSEINKPKYWYDGSVSVREHLEAVFSERGFEVISVKVMINQIEKRPDILRVLRELGVTCVGLRRTNALQIYISMLRARTFQRYSAERADSNTGKKVRVELDDLWRELPKIVAANEEIEHIASMFNRSIVLDYDDTVQNIQATVEKISELVDYDLGDQNVSTPTHKLSPPSLKLSVVNYSDVVESLNSTPYERFIY